MFKISFALEDLFLKKEEIYNNAHGKYKGVMDIKSSNNPGDDYLVSCGNEDDSKIIIWDIKKKSALREIENDSIQPFYWINLFIFPKVIFLYIIL